MKSFSILFSFLFLLTIGVESFANNTQNQNNSQQGAQTKPRTGGGASIDMGSNQGMKADASQSSSQEKLGQALNVAMGAALIAAGYATSPDPNWPLIIMGIGNIAQAALMSKASGRAGNVGSMSTDFCTYAGCDSFDAGSGGNVASKNKGGGNVNKFGGGGAGARVDDLMDKLKKDGFKMNPDGSVTDPSGKTYAAGFGSASDLKKAGMKAGDLAQIESIKNKYGNMYKKAMSKVSAMGFNNAGGGSGGSSFQVDDSDPFADFFGRMKKKGVRGPASVAGMKKNFNGEEIGVAQDDIFQMIHRRYKKKKASGFFLGH